MNRANSLVALGIWGESRTLLRNQLLPAARRSLGPDHDYTLKLCQTFALALCDNPACHRDDPRFNQLRRGDATRFNLDTGDDLLEAETIMQDVVRRRRRVFGPAHPATLLDERTLSSMRA